MIGMELLSIYICSHHQYGAVYEAEPDSRVIKFITVRRHERLELKDETEEL